MDALPIALAEALAAYPRERVIDTFLYVLVVKGARDPRELPPELARRLSQVQARPEAFEPHDGLARVIARCFTAHGATRAARATALLGAERVTPRAPSGPGNLLAILAAR